MVEITRRKAITGVSGLATVGLAGCTSSVDGFLGPEFEEGDEQEVMLEASFFGDDWSEESMDDGEPAEDDGDGYEWTFDRDEVPDADAMFVSGDEDAMALAMIAIVDDEDEAEEAVEDYGRSQMVNPEDPDIGDTAVRGEISSMGVICYHGSNAVVVTGAMEIQGFGAEPNNSLALEAAEEIESRLENL
ncbi:hypothetical protein [Natronococcus amylolyticus]|nr:hypothetical protein [Natronococcus amylolyticus]